MKIRAQLKLKHLSVITFAWLIVGFLVTMYDYFVLHTQLSRGPTDEYSFLFSMTINMGSAFEGALLGGSFLVFFVNVKYQDKPYGYTIVAVGISFILIILLITVIVGLIIAQIRTGKSIIDMILKIDFENFLFDNARTIKSTIVWSVVVALTQLFLQLNSKFGHGSFLEYHPGKIQYSKRGEQDINVARSRFIYGNC